MTRDLIALKKYSGVKFDAAVAVKKPLISSVVMGLIVLLLYRLSFMLTDSNSISTVISIFAGVVVYGLMILKTKAISRDELMTISAGRKLAAICDRLKLW